MSKSHHPSHPQCNTPGYPGESAPQTISEDSRNTSNYRGHTHAIEHASTEQAGIVKLNNTLTSEAVHEALTAAKGKELAERINELTEESQNEEINRRLEAALGYLSTRYNAAYPTHARALSRVSVLPNNALVYVVNDPDETKNGLYYVDALSLIKAPFDALSTAFTTDAMRVFQSIMTEAPYTELTYNGVGTYSVSTIKAIVEEFKIEKEEKYLEMFDRADAGIDVLIRNGMVRGFETEALLKQWKPPYTGARAKADDTKKVWRWELTSDEGTLPVTGVWVNTGLSELDQAKEYADSNPNFKAVTLTEDTDLNSVLAEGNYRADVTVARNTELNYPIAEAGSLTVGLIGFASHYQVYTTLTGKMYLRTKSVNWGAWKLQGMDLTHPKLTSTVLPPNTNLDDVTTHGSYSFVTTNALTEFNFPFKDNGTLVVERAGNASLSQVVYCMTGRAYVRFKSASWGAWIEIPTANRIMALVGESPKIATTLLPANTDLDSLTAHGVYSFSSGNADLALNFPLKDSGTLIVDRLGNVSLSQLALCLTGRMFMRFKSVNWGAWVEIATVNALLETIKLEGSKQAKARLSVPDLTSITSSSYVVIPVDPQGNALNPLISKNPLQSLPPASLTKTMTALLAIESGTPLDTPVNILAEDIVTGSGFNFFKEGDTVTLRDCLHGMMLPSANIAALAVARTIGGTVADFVVQMNNKAYSLGMGKTTFKNPTGLSASGQVSTANDLALLTKAALENSVMRSIWGQHSYTFEASGEVRTMTSSLVAVQNYEPWALGGKTGTLGSICNQLTAIRLPNGYIGIVIQMNALSSENRANDVATLSLYCANKFCYPSPNQIVETILY